MPRPGRAGHLAYNYAISRFLTDAGHRVTIMLTRPRLAWPVQRTRAWLDPARVAIEGPGLISGAGVTAMRRPGDVARSLASHAVDALPPRLRTAARRRLRSGRYGSVDAVLGRFMEAPAIDWCATRILAMRPDALLIDTIFRAPLLRDPRLHATASVLLAHDVFHLRHAGLAAQGYRLHPAAIDAPAEARWLALAGTVAAIQPEEAHVFRSMLPATRVIVVGMPVAANPRPAGSRREPDRLVFVGSASLPNVDGLRWFLDRVWPGLRERRPGAQLDICGEVCAMLATADPRVRLLGRVHDLAPVLHRASLAVAPLRAGSGLKIKLLDCLAHGLAVVTTPAGAAGLPSSPAVLTVDGACAMATLIDRVLDDDAVSRDAAALALADRYQPAIVFADLAAALGV